MNREIQTRESTPKELETKRPTQKAMELGGFILVPSALNDDYKLWLLTTTRVVRDNGVVM